MVSPSFFITSTPFGRCENSCARNWTASACCPSNHQGLNLACPCSCLAHELRKESVEPYYKQLQAMFTYEVRDNAAQQACNTLLDYRASRVQLRLRRRACGERHYCFKNDQSRVIRRLQRRALT